MQGQRSLVNAGERLSASTLRLSSGLRINSAADDAAGLAIAAQLNSSSRIYTQAIRNLNDGLNVLNIAEGAVSELEGIVIRQKEIAEEAANGVYSARQRRALDAEAVALTNEYNRIVSSTSVNGYSLLGATGSTQISIQAGFGEGESLSIAFGDPLMDSIGDGTFGSRITFALASAGRLDIGDLNNDGSQDLIVLTPTQPKVLLGNGDGTFDAPIPHFSHCSAERAMQSCSDCGKMG